jgi:hypothetical protein
MNEKKKSKVKRKGVGKGREMDEHSEILAYTRSAGNSHCTLPPTTLFS